MIRWRYSDGADTNAIQKTLTIKATYMLLKNGGGLEPEIEIEKISTVVRT
jgi:hypothetical protein